MPDGKLDSGLMASVRQRFHAEHHRTYGRAGTDELVEIVNLRVRGRVRNPVGVERLLGLPPSVPRAATTRECRFDRTEPTPVIPRAALSPEPRQGPLVIEDMDSTTLVPPEATAHRDRFNNIVISWTTTAPEAAS